MCPRVEQRVCRPSPTEQTVVAPACGWSRNAAPARVEPSRKVQCQQPTSGSIRPRSDSMCWITGCTSAIGSPVFDSPENPSIHLLCRGLSCDTDRHSKGGDRSEPGANRSFGEPRATKRRRLCPNLSPQELHKNLSHGLDIVNERPMPEPLKDMDLGQREVPLLLFGELHLDERIARSPDHADRKSLRELGHFHRLLANIFRGPIQPQHGPLVPPIRVFHHPVEKRVWHWLRAHFVERPLHSPLGGSQL